MHTTLMDPRDWALNEFGGADLGDERRGDRLMQVAASLCRHSHGTLPGSFDNWPELRAAYRLFENPGVRYEDIVSPHVSRVRQECRQPADYLLVADTTELDFTSHQAARDLGRIGNDSGRGLWLHSMLAMRIEGWNDQGEPLVTVHGLAAQQCWARTMPTKGRHSESTHQRLGRDRESQRWAAAIMQVGDAPQGVRWTYIADRESDIYEVFLKCRQQRWDFIVRANRPRALAQDEGWVSDALAAAPILGRFELALRSRPQRAIKQNEKGQPKRVRLAHPAQVVELEVRACAVKLRGAWRPGGRLSPCTIHAVQAREVNPAQGDEPIHWVLLTSWPCQGFEQAMRIVKAYRRRWLIEEYHKCLKTGTRIQDTQLSTARSIKALLGILAVSAVRLLNRKLLASARPDDAVATTDIGEETLVILEAQYGRPPDGWTHRSILNAVAKLGGFPARKGDGSPGWLTLWRGWELLMTMARGFELAQKQRCG